MRPTAPKKAETALLEPFVGLPLGLIQCPQTDEELESATAEILAAGTAGFDTESKPTFAPGELSRGPHVVQLALHTRAFVFQLCVPGCAETLIPLLESARLLKVGFGLQSDRVNIRRRLGAEPRAVLDLDAVFRKRGYRGTIGVRAAVGIALGQRFHKSKKLTTSSWGSARLSPGQLLYAANDAFAALKVYEALGLGRDALESQGGERDPLDRGL